MKKSYFEPNVEFVVIEDNILFDSQSAPKGVYDENPNWFGGN